MVMVMMMTMMVKTVMTLMMRMAMITIKRSDEYHKYAAVVAHQFEDVAGHFEKIFTRSRTKVESKSFVG